MRLIGITGRAGAGKDETAKYIAEKYGYRQDSFAAPIYTGLSAMLDIPVEVLQDRGYKEGPPPGLGEDWPSIRYLLQTLGTEWGRDIVKQDVWLDLALHRHETYQGGTVISDVRFDNEGAWVAEQGVLIEVVRPGAAIPEAGHASEAGAATKYASIILVNDSSLNELHNKIDYIMGEIG